MDNQHSELDLTTLSFQDRLQAMQEKFTESLPGRLLEINQAWEQVQSSHGKQESLEFLHRLVHTLTGSAGTFGYQKLSVDLRALEILLKGVIHSPETYGLDEIRMQIQSMLDTLESLSKSVSKSYFNQAIARTSPESKSMERVLILDDDQSLNGYLAAQFDHFGYQIKSVESLERFDAAVKEFKPDLVIADISFPEGDLAGIDAVKQLMVNNHVEHEVPVIFISAQQDINTRLQAVRANGMAYFPKPINISALLDKVRALIGSVEIEPYQIMVVDDDPALVDLIIYVLEQFKMVVRGITNPQNVLEEISSHKPDLILMDLHMPWCSGVELAQVIRQQSNLATIPIVFLSSETDEDIQFQAVLKGGDEFLSKPFDVNRLPVFIESRAARARIMSSLMVRDGLTGLYNHSYIKEMIEMEMHRTLRTHSEFCVVMLDIDSFKQVNDTYGHTVGDQVLRSLSHFLLQRFRKSDKIGRYGGEEFMIVLPDTTLDNAEILMNSALDSFKKVIHNGTEVDFHVTFSAGVISSNMTHDVDKLVEEVDKALYNAKRAGRNQVAIAQIPT